MDQQADPNLTNQPEAETEKHEFLNHLENAVTNLPLKMGRAFAMRELEGLSTDEITREPHISKANLWVLIHRAKQNLSEELVSEWIQVGEFWDRLSA